MARWRGDSPSAVTTHRTIASRAATGARRRMDDSSSCTTSGEWRFASARKTGFGNFGIGQIGLRLEREGRPDRHRCLDELFSDSAAVALALVAAAERQSGGIKSAAASGRTVSSSRARSSARSSRPRPPPPPTSLSASSSSSSSLPILLILVGLSSSSSPSPPLRRKSQASTSRSADAIDSGGQASAAIRTTSSIRFHSSRPALFEPEKLIVRPAPLP
mmetsp:Transcript_9023/g.16775  ORF Transcript_9023/g.16775 Transcript_9023/m.16775 type:complete len:218 (+) Transcript_9023:1502-2155(+)